jgi:hypothetical protein
MDPARGLGKAAYQAYCARLGTAPVVPWRRLPAVEQLAWHRAAWAAIATWENHLTTQAALQRRPAVHERQEAP